MAKLIYGFNARALRRAAEPDEHIAAPLSETDLAALGIPAARIPRVREELARLALQDARLLDRATLEQLAVALSKQLRQK